MQASLRIHEAKAPATRTWVERIYAKNAEPVSDTACVPDSVIRDVASRGYWIHRLSQR